VTHSAWARTTGPGSYSARTIGLALNSSASTSTQDAARKSDLPFVRTRMVISQLQIFQMFGNSRMVNLSTKIKRPGRASERRSLY